MNIKPIKNRKDYETALKHIENLMSAKKNSKEGDKLDILVTLVQAYETKNFPISAPDPIVVIEHCMEALGMTRKDLEPILGSKSKVSEVLNKKRALSITMVRNLHEHMSIPAHVLIQEYELKQAAG